jgi:hypothetical protein
MRCCEISFTLEEQHLGFVIENSTLSFKADLGYVGGNLSYKPLSDKPKINGVTLIDDKSFEDLGDFNLTNMEIQNLFNRVFRRGE